MNLNSFRIPKQSLDEFKAIWLAKHGEDLSDDEAAEIAQRLLRALSIVLNLAEAPSDCAGSNPVAID